MRLMAQRGDWSDHAQRPRRPAGATGA